MTVQRRIRTTLAATITTILLLALQPATAQISTRMDAVELSPKFIILPGNTNGMMTFRACSSVCEEVPHQRVRLTPNTKFTVNGKAVKFEEFRARFSAIRSRDSGFALVSYLTESKTVTQLDIAG